MRSPLSWLQVLRVTESVGFHPQLCAVTTIVVEILRVTESEGFHPQLGAVTNIVFEFCE